MSVERLMAVVREWMEGVWQEGDETAVDRLHASDFVDHNPAGRAPDREGFKEGVAELYRAFPDFFAETEDLIADPLTGKVALRWAATGTHQGIFIGVPPTGKRIAFRGIEILRIENDRIVERWGEWDSFNIMEQLGLTPTR